MRGLGVRGTALLFCGLEFDFFVHVFAVLLHRTRGITAVRSAAGHVSILAVASLVGAPGHFRGPGGQGLPAFDFLRVLAVLFGVFLTFFRLLGRRVTENWAVLLFRGGSAQFWASVALIIVLMVSLH